MRVLIVGAGRNGLRHLAGVAPLADEVAVVDPREEALEEAARRSGSETRVSGFASLDEVDLDGIGAAIDAATAAGRMGRVRAIARHVRELLIEKPLEQSRTAARALVETVEEQGARAICHHWPRLLPFAEELRRAEGDVHLSVVGGAWGLGNNGVHWLDLAAYASGRCGELLWGEIDPEEISSGRGRQFRDYGGRAVFAFGGSRLFLSSDPDSSAPYLVIAATRSSLLALDVANSQTRRYTRDPASTKPPYLHGQDYTLSDDAGALERDPEPVSAAWLRGVVAGAPPERFATLRESLRAHELAFDLLETGGGREFPIT